MNKKLNIVILTGAGISKESGIATFRDSDGTWNQFRVEDVATPEAFARNPTLVHEFYNRRRQELKNIEPNAAHKALVKLELNWRKGRVFLITQNCDNLHEKAGSRNLLYLHGSLLKVRCVKCQHVYKSWDDLSVETPCPRCQRTNCLRPNIVWFNEIPRRLSRVYQALHQCSYYIAIGTSGAVYPASQFVGDARQARAKTIELNLARTDVSHNYHETRLGPATETVSQLVEELLDVSSQ